MGPAARTGEAPAEMAQDDEGPELADAVDELHTELWFWQSAMGYTDNATVQVTVTGEKRPSSQEHRLPWWRRPLARDGV